LFVLSIVSGLVGQMVPRAVVLFVASGVIFGVAMVEVGRQVLLGTAIEYELIRVVIADAQSEPTCTREETGRRVHQ